MRYSEASHGDTRSPVEVQLSGVVVVTAGQYIEFFGQSYDQVTLSHTVAGSGSSLIKIASINAPVDMAQRNTPRRVSTLPAPADSLDQDLVFVTGDYTKANGIDILPAPFAETSLDGFSVGTRGWGRGLDGYSLGDLHPDDSELDNLLLVSDTRIVVRRGTLTNLSHLVIGATEYALTYVPQTDYTISSLEGSPQADYYTLSLIHI